MVILENWPSLRNLSLPIFDNLVQVATRNCGRLVIIVIVQGFDSLDTTLTEVIGQPPNLVYLVSQAYRGTFQSGPRATYVCLPTSTYDLYHRQSKRNSEGVVLFSVGYALPHKFQLRIDLTYQRF